MVKKTRKPKEIHCNIIVENKDENLKHQCQVSFTIRIKNMESDIIIREKNKKTFINSCPRNISGLWWPDKTTKKDNVRSKPVTTYATDQDIVTGMTSPYTKRSNLPFKRDRNSVRHLKQIGKNSAP